MDGATKGTIPEAADQRVGPADGEIKRKPTQREGKGRSRGENFRSRKKVGEERDAAIRLITDHLLGAL